MNFDEFPWPDVRVPSSQVALLSGFFPPERFVFGTQELSKRTFLSTAFSGNS